MMKSLLGTTLLSLFTFGCATESATDEPAAGQQPVAEAAVHDAICGHVLDEVGHCGNYIRIDDEYVVLEWPELGRMEFCGAGEKGAKVKVTGEMVEGKFVAASYERVK